MTGAGRPQSAARGVAFMCAATGMFALLNAGAKYLAGERPMVQLLWARTAGHLLFAVLAFGPRYGRQLLATRSLGSQVALSLLLLSSTAFNFLALRWIGLAAAAAINFTAPALVALMAAWSLGERVSLRRWAAILVGFAGALVVIGPGLEAAQLGAIFSAGTAVCYAGYQILTRKVADADRPETTVGYSALVGTVVSSLVVPFVWVTPRSPSQALILASLGLWGGVGHYFVARAFYWAPATVVSPFNYLQLLGAAITGYLIFGDVPGPALWIGAALIVGSGLYILLDERAGRAARTPGPTRAS